MRVYGIDFTSRPRPGKPITCAVCRATEGRLVLEEMRPLANFAAFEALLAEPGPWIAGIDCPFGQSRRFIENIGWPTSWASYVDLVGGIALDPSGDALDALLSAVQAAWAWSKRDSNYGIPTTADPLEGWIVDESLYEAAV